MHTKLLRHHLSKLNLVVVGHVTEAYGAVQALREYLDKTVDEFNFITHPLYNYRGYSSHQFFIKGQKFSESNVKIRKMPEFLHYLLSFIFTLRFVLKSKKRYNIYIGIDNLNAAAGMFLKKIGMVDKVVFYVGDFSRARFKFIPINIIYNYLTRFCAKYADVVWSITQRAGYMLEQQGAWKKNIIVVPNGVDFNKIPKFRSRNSESQKRLIFVGHLTQTKGVETFLKEFPNITRNFPDVMLFIVGTGPYQKQLKELVNSLNLRHCVKFLGFMNHDDVLKFLPSCDVGLAPYTYQDDYVKYCDPVKVKEYLACGCAVIISDIPEIASEISREHAGLVYKNMDELTQSLLKLLKCEALLNEYRKNALKLSKKYDWTSIFDRSFYATLRAKMSNLDVR
jgi:glycosyltransferase involved in cell wall biosynthesis